MSSDSSDSPPPESNTPPSSSPPPPSDDNSSSPPPPSGDNSSPPPPSDSSQSPPPPSDDNSPPPSSPPPSSPPPSSPPPPSDDQKSPPPPDNDNGSSQSPPPPPPNNKSPNHQPPPPPSVGNGKFSPPPPRHELSEPSPNSGKSNNTPSSDGGGGSSIGVPAIIGIAAGAGLLLLVAILLIIACSRRKKKSSDSPVRYFNHTSDDNYFKRQNPPAAGPNQYGYNNNREHVLNIPPPPGAVWGGALTPPPPPPPQFNSSEMSSSSYSNSGPHGPVLPPPHPSVALGFNQSSFTFEELSAATSGFTQRNLLGEGGFGYVHKGFLPNGKEIAVKSLKSTGGQGDREFQAEVDTISRVHHRHLVSLVGYSISDSKKLLVYEFVPNKTLEYHLHGKGRPVMDWGTRLRIAIGSAKGLAYLHEDCHPRIIHRDIKAANILIENNFDAKVSDFGLAKFSQDTNTHVSTRVMGTFGYMAPEYASSGKLTDKSDVFSYGIMLLELITGRRPIDNTAQYEDQSLVDWARPVCVKAIESGSFEELVDPRLEGNYIIQEIAHMVACASACVRHSAKRRPRMSQVVRVLEGDVSLDVLNHEGVKPGQSTMYSGASSGEYGASAYLADMKQFKKLALESGTANSDLYGNTSEYGLNLSASSSDQSTTEYTKGTGISRDHTLHESETH
ncbi:PREDICTED: proline-rich receptor-like protein kinase PERK4 [Lupinus angustifolius]|uniref:proline-rich receptor-like protein kinase PERK4 n=1 Tax=Lupinus angustifolius TaxID=3871 RepID=UPI00092F6783|nr:PREDICTED: proline-rich receptor-like protein kinase PERK4 [Lupinus angustifolius]XP_019416476.1 PREDICTED: proline-rich receptor-like protein kinase PERK4 [Lupinus angustifolius]